MLRGQRLNDSRRMSTIKRQTFVSWLHGFGFIDRPRYQDTTGRRGQPLRRVWTTDVGIRYLSDWQVVASGATFVDLAPRGNNG